jgi:hypothetical protein
MMDVLLQVSVIRAIRRGPRFGFAELFSPGEDFATFLPGPQQNSAFFWLVAKGSQYAGAGAPGAHDFFLDLTYCHIRENQNACAKMLATRHSPGCAFDIA